MNKKIFSFVCLFFLFYSSTFAMQIWVTNQEGRTVPLEVEPTDRIEDVKRQIQQKEGIAVDHQVLIFAGRVLENDYTLQDYSIQKDSSLKLIVSRTTSCGDFTVGGGILGADFTFDNSTLRILTATPLTIRGVSSRDRIEVSTGVSAEITLKGVSIQSPNCAFELLGTSSCHLILEGENVLKSDSQKAGLQVAEEAILTIDGPGSLRAMGGEGAAGIGGSKINNAGIIKIRSGFVTAMGGYDGAGIGGGHANDERNQQFGGFVAIEISGGTVVAHATGNAAAIGTGCWSKCTTAKITIEKALVYASTLGSHAPCAAIGRGIIPSGSNAIEVNIAQSVVYANNIENKGPSIGGTAGTIASSIIYVNNGSQVSESPTLPSLYVPKGKNLSVPQGVSLTVEETIVNQGIISVGGYLMLGDGTSGTYTGTNASVLVLFDGGSVSDNLLPFLTQDALLCGDFIVQGGTKDIDYTWSEPLLRILTSTPLSISSVPTTHRIVVNSGVDANISLKGVSIDVSGVDEGKACPFELAENASCVLSLGGENSLHSSYHKAGLQVPSSAKLTIVGSGSLAATGEGVVKSCGRECFEYYCSAGIGGGSGMTAGQITIRGGVITAQGGGVDRAGSIYGAAGIGGGQGGSVLTVEIYGGTIHATGGHGAAGIGCGAHSQGGTIAIHGGMLTATGGPGGFFNYKGVGLGARDLGGAISITGGSVVATGANGGIKGQPFHVSDAFVSASFIYDQSDKDNWSGVIFEEDLKGSKGLVYGSPLQITTPFVIPQGRELMVESGQTLEVVNGLTNNGTITNCGMIIGEVKGSPALSGGVVTFDINGGEGIGPATTTCTRSVVLPSSDGFAYERHVFSTWNTKADGSGDDYQVGSTCAVIGDQTFFAKWQLDSCELTVNGQSVIHGVTTPDFSFHKPVLKILSSEPIRLSGTTLRDRIEVADGVTATLILDQVKISFTDGKKASHSSDESMGGSIALKLGAASTLHIVLKENSDNHLKSGECRPGIYVPDDASLHISGLGRLTAIGGTWGAGIGGGLWNNAGSITISSGFVTALGGEDAAGIGGGHANDGMDKSFGGVVAINIDGGTVVAKGKGNTAGIGTGCWSKCSTAVIRIENAAVFASTTGQFQECAAIGRGIVPNEANEDIAIAITNSVVSAINNRGFSIGGGPSITSSLVEVSNGTSFAGSPTLPSLYIPVDQLVRVPNGTRLTVEGSFVNDGAIRACGEILGPIENHPPEEGYTVSYNLNGGTGKVPPHSPCQAKDEGVRVESFDEFHREGFTIAGWNTAADGSGISALPGQYFRYTEDVELFAIWIEGEGTEETPYLLYTPADLLAFYNWVYLASHTRGVVFKMMNDIDMSQVVGFKSIGGRLGFSGIFDGNGKRILHLNIQEESYQPELGLFAYVNEGAVIKNVGIENANIVSPVMYTYMGALVGIAQGARISNCYARNCTIQGAEYSTVGGLVGVLTNNAVVENCYTLSGSFHTQEGILGGLVGGSFSEDTIRNSYACPSHLSNTNSPYSGVFMGESSAMIYLLNNYCLSEVDAVNTPSANTNPTNVVAKTPEEFQDCQFKQELNQGASYWIYNPALNESYPALSWQGRDSATFVVKFDSKGGTSIEELRCVILGSKLSEVTPPMKDKHHFLGWCIDESYTSFFDFTNAVITQDTTLWAAWKPDLIKKAMQYDTLCSNQSLHWRSKTYTQSGVFYDTLRSPVGIPDTIYGLDLLVFPAVERLEVTMDSCEQVCFDHIVYVADTVILDTLRNGFGCDSLITTVKIKVRQSSSSYIRLDSIGKVTFKDRIYTRDTLWVDTLVNAALCDSFLTVNIYVRRYDKPPIYIQPIAFANICKGEEFLWRNQSLREAGLYTDTLKLVDEDRADTVFRLQLEVQIPDMLGIKYKRILYVNNSERLLKKDFQWYFNGTEISGANKQYFDTEGKLDGMYQVRLSYLDGQKAMTCPKQFTLEPAVALVSPNPVSKEKNSEILILHAESMNVQNMSLKIYSVQGNLIHEASVSGHKIPIPSGLKPGSYIVHIVTPDQEILQAKFLIQN